MTKKKTESTAATGAAADGDDGEVDEPSGSSAPSSAEYSVAFSPRQVAVGFAIVAGLVAIVLRRRGRKARRDD
jgi:hypothetical protein